MLKQSKWMGLVIACFALCTPLTLAEAASKDLLHAPRAETDGAVRALAPPGSRTRKLSKQFQWYAMRASGAGGTPIPATIAACWKYTCSRQG